MHKLFTYGPLRGPSLLVAVAAAGWLLSYLVDGSGLCYFFMGVWGVYYMTLNLGGDVPSGGACYLAGSSHSFMTFVVEDDMTEGWDTVVPIGRSVSGFRVAGQSTRDRPAGLLAIGWPSLCYPPPSKLCFN